MSREETQTPDQVIIYPLTTRRMATFYLLCSTCWIVGLAYVHFFMAPVHISVPLIIGLFFGACFAVIHAIVLKLRQEKRKVRYEGIVANMSVTSKRRVRTGSAWGSVTMLGVRYQLPSGPISTERAVHPVIWQRADIGHELPIRISPRNPAYWVAAVHVDENELYEIWKRTSFMEKFAW